MHNAQAVIEYIASPLPYIVIGTIVSLGISGPITILDLRKNLKKNNDNDYTWAGVVVIFSGVIWPVTLGFFLLMGVCRSIPWTMRKLTEMGKTHD